MILYADDNAGLLFIKNIEVEVQDQYGNATHNFDYEYEEDAPDDTLDANARRRKKQQKDVLILVEVFLKVCH